VNREVKPMSQQAILDRHGNPVKIKRFPPKGSRGKFKSSNPGSNDISPFERFKDSNSTKGRQYSF
jgi:hypothetical protein